MRGRPTVRESGGGYKTNQNTCANGRKNRRTLKKGILKWEVTKTKVIYIYDKIWEWWIMVTSANGGLLSSGSLNMWKRKSATLTYLGARKRKPSSKTYKGGTRPPTPRMLNVKDQDIIGQTEREQRVTVESIR